MSNENQTPFSAGDSDVVNNVMRLVIPMRREFSISLDLQRFMRDATYAKEVIEKALVSSDAKLRERADYLRGKIFGVRAEVTVKAVSLMSTSLPVSAPVPAVSAPAGIASVEPIALPVEEESEAAMRARMMSKYKTGLR
jgi:hypothetical protein